LGLLFSVSKAGGEVPFRRLTEVDLFLAVNVKAPRRKRKRKRKGKRKMMIVMSRRRRSERDKRRGLSLKWRFSGRP
jgi:hypothetical protein